MKEEKFQYETNILNLNNRIAEIEKMLADFNILIEDKEKELKNKDIEIQKLKEDVQKITKTKKDLENLLKEKEKEIESLKFNIQSLESKINMLSKEFYSKESVDKQNELSELARINESLRKKWNNLYVKLELLYLELLKLENKNKGKNVR